MKKNNMNIEKNIDRLKKGIPTAFLEGFEVQNLIGQCKKRNITYKIFSIFEECEKVIFYQNILPSISCYKLNCKEELTHSEILGSLFSHQLNSETFGDIIITENTAYIVILDTIAPYIENFFQKVGNKKVKLEKVFYSEIEHFHYAYEEKEIIIPSNRLDNILVKLCKMGRKQVQDKLSHDEIRINYEVVVKPSYKLQENDILSIRRVGKFKYKKNIGKTKKDNEILLFQQFL